MLFKVFAVLIPGVYLARVFDRCSEKSSADLNYPQWNQKKISINFHEGWPVLRPDFSESLNPQLTVKSAVSGGETLFKHHFLFVFLH